MADLGTSTSLSVALTEIEKRVVQAETDRDNLKTNLSAKGVDTTNISKMSGLVNGVKNIELGKKWASGTVKVAPAGNYGFPKGEIRGLTFKPNIIVLVMSNAAYKMRHIGIRCDSYNNTETVTGSAWWITPKDNGGNVSSNTIVFFEDGFDVNPANHSTGFHGIHNWIAFE